jgi:predicted ArsR family transcriptional regulator
MQTERDAKIVDWIGRLGAAGIDQVARWFGMHPQTAKERLASLAKDGLLERHMVLYGRPALYTATRAGFAMAGSRLHEGPPGDAGWVRARVAGGRDRG